MALYVALVVAAMAGGALGVELLPGVTPLREQASSFITITQPPRVFVDALASNTHNWLTDGHCFFTSGAYHALPGTGAGSVVCSAPVGTFTDFDLRVTAWHVSGPLDYPYGLVFRRVNAGNFYIFVVDGDGLAWFGRYAAGHYQQLSHYWATRPFPQPAGAATTLRVVAVRSNFTFSVQGQNVGSASDSSYADGTVGVFSGFGKLEAAFTDFAISDFPLRRMRDGPRPLRRGDSVPGIPWGIHCSPSPLALHCSSV